MSSGDEREVGAHARGQVGDAEGVEIAEHAVGGQHDEAGIVERGERHEGEIGGVIGVERGDFALRGLLVAIGQGGLVAVVAVGDEELALAEEAGDGGGERSSCSGQRRWPSPFSSVKSAAGGWSVWGGRSASSVPSGSS